MRSLPVSCPWLCWSKSVLQGANTPWAVSPGSPGEFWGRQSFCRRGWWAGFGQGAAGTDVVSGRCVGP